MAEAALLQYEKPDVESEVEQALAICGGDAMAASRTTLIANAFLERRGELLLAGQSAGYARTCAESSIKKTKFNKVDRTYRPF
jgi:hypothetical protein